MQVSSSNVPANSFLINQIAEKFENYSLKDTENALKSKICVTDILYNSDGVSLRNSWLERIKRIATSVIGIIIFPLGMYWAFKSKVESLLMPVVTKERRQIAYQNVTEFFNSGALDPKVGAARIARIAVAVEGCLIDAYVVSPCVSTLKNRRWTLVAGGNSTSAQCNALKACCDGSNSLHRNLASSLDHNLLFFDYSGVMASEGGLSLDMMAKSYDAMRKMICDKTNGFQAKDLMMINSSMGGGVSARGRANRPYSQEISHLVVNVSTYASLVKEIEVLVTNKTRPILGPVLSALLGRIMSWFAEKWDWKVDVAAESMRLIDEGIPEIILYSDADTVIPPEASLAHAVKDFHDPEKKAVLFLQQNSHIPVAGNPHTVHPIKETLSVVNRLAKHYLGRSQENPKELIEHFSA